MLNDYYKAALVGTHGCGKSYLCNLLSDFFKVYDEAPLNEYMGVNAYLSEKSMYDYYTNINEHLRTEYFPCISDRFGIISVLLYSEGFNRLGWMSDDDLYKVNNLVNNNGVDWVLPEKILYINENINTLKSRIKSRGRKGLNEEDGLYLGTINELYKDYFHGFDVFPGLNNDIKKSFRRIPFVRIKSTDSLESIISKIL